MNREDHLIYRSVKFEKKSNSTDPSSLTLKDNNLGEDVKILKMT
jgi:tRNA threonylcarbamoyladenosine modification (KEOPS) complex  Pcc1 subunit